jgi:hypothetical protein
MEGGALGTIPIGSNSIFTGMNALMSDPRMTLSAMGQSVQGIGTATNAQRMLMASQMMGAGGMGGGTQTQMRPPQAPGLKPAQAPQVNQAMAGLLDERARMPQRRRMSLL